MTDFFRIYEILAKSGLFDAEFYVSTYPDVLSLNMDALTHYIEIGAKERRNPSANFDSASYIRAHGTSEGEIPNPLLHYIAQINSRPSANAALTSQHLLFIDSPGVNNGIANAPVTGRLTLVGWALARAGVEKISIHVNGAEILDALYGMRRADVAQQYKDWDDSGHSGFLANIPANVLPKGRQQISVCLHDKVGKTSKSEFVVEVKDFLDDVGPWALRTKMSQGEIDLNFRILTALDWAPKFAFWLLPSAKAGWIEDARRTVSSLCRQPYPHWQLTVVKGDGKSTERDLEPTLLDGSNPGVGHIRFVTQAENANERKPKREIAGSSNRRFVGALRAGDELGCDALIEMAITTALDKSIDFIYADERRLNPATSQTEAYFKPAWSPDLLLSTNYIGRMWCVDERLAQKSDVTVRSIVNRGEYDALLRSTEHAKSIVRIPKVLSKRGTSDIDDGPADRIALKQSLVRREIDATIEDGHLPGVFRVKRRVSRPGLVSIIVPTCAARALIETCIQTIRNKTRYKNFEIICIENIPQERRKWKSWLQRNADKVIETKEPFNWSRFNNIAASEASGKFLLFLNDDVEVIDPDWLSALLEHGQRPDVGAVGPQLLYPDRSVQHAGIVLNQIGKGRHVFRHLREDEPGYFGLALTQRNVIAVTGACLMTRAEVFKELHGFDEAHTIINNDFDYCLRAWRKGLLNVYTPHTKLIHHELASRSDLGEDYDASAFGDRWRQVFSRGDPYSNPNISLDSDDIQPEREPVRVFFPGGRLIPIGSIRQIVVFKLDHIGDCISALPAIQHLRSCFPESLITVVAASSTKPIWADESSVNAVIEFDFFHDRSGLGIADISESEMEILKRRLLAGKFDLAIDLRKQPDTRHLLRLSGAKWMAGFDYQGRFPWLDVAIEWEGDPPLVRKHHHVSEDLVRIIDAVRASTERTGGPKKASVIAKLPLTPDQLAQIFSKRVVCIHPSVGNQMRQWPLIHFSELIHLLIEYEGVNIVLVGAEGDRNVVTELKDTLREKNAVFDLTGKLTLRELKSFLTRCQLFIGNNSGPKHLAAAVGIPTIGIHDGVVDAMEWGPSGQSAVAIQRAVSCSPCYLTKPEECVRNLACLSGLQPGEIYKLSKRMLVLTSGVEMRVHSTKRSNISST